MRNLKTLNLSDKQLQQTAQPTPADIAAAVLLWQSVVPLKWKHLLDTPNKYFVWDNVARQYFDIRTRKFIPFETIREQAIEPLIANSKQVQRIYSERLQSGAMSLAEWESAMLNNIKLTQLASALAANGGLNNTNANDEEKIAALILLLLLFFKGFSKSIADGTQTLNGTLLVRSDLYASSARGIFAEMITYSATTYLKKTQERRILQPGDNCHSNNNLTGCVEWAAKGWVAIGGTPPIGSAVCLSNCRCKKEYR